MQHCDCGEKVSLYLDGLLDPEQVKYLQQHLAQNETCRMQWEAMHRISSLLQSEPLASPGPGFAGRVTARLQERDVRRKRARSGLRLLVGYAGVGGVVAGVFAFLFVLLWQPLIRVVFLRVIVPSGSRAVSFLSVLGRALYAAARDLLTRPTWFLLLGYAVAALGLAALWTCVVVRPQVRTVGMKSEL